MKHIEGIIIFVVIMIILVILVGLVLGWFSPGGTNVPKVLL